MSHEWNRTRLSLPCPYEYVGTRGFGLSTLRLHQCCFFGDTEVNCVNFIDYLVDDTGKGRAVTTIGTRAATS